MTTFTKAAGSRTSGLALSTLASATYIASSAIDLTAVIPEDVVLEAECNPNGTPSGNKQLIIFVQISIDGTNYGTGPTSGTTATEEADLLLVGVLPTNDTNDHRKQFSLREAGIPIARYLKIVAKNDLGVALTSGTVYYSVITGVGA